MPCDLHEVRDMSEVQNKGRDGLQDPDLGDPRTNDWTIHIIDDAKSNSSTTSAFFTSCMESEVAGGVYEPFWKGFPFCDIHLSITPHVLHQLYQGIFKHLLSWCQMMLGTDELDRRVRNLPPMYNTRHFKNGISGLAQVTGTKRKHMARILLGCLVSSIPAGVIRAIKGLLDFIYLAQYTTHNTTTLQYLRDALQLFHNNKQTLLNLGVRDNFNFPKIHSLLHYITSIELYGTTDNYNTEMFERFHIDFAKEGWRASNKRNERPQMVIWLERQEKVAMFDSYLSAMHPSKPSKGKVLTNNIGYAIRIRKTPKRPSQSLQDIVRKHHCPGLQRDLKSYLNSFHNQEDELTRTALENARLPFGHIDVYHSFKFSSNGVGDDDVLVKDVVKARPASKESPACFDTVVALDTVEGEASGLQGTQYALYFSNINPRSLTIAIRYQDRKGAIDIPPSA